EAFGLVRGGVEAVGAVGVGPVLAGAALAALLASALVDRALGVEEALEDLLLALERLAGDAAASELAGGFLHLLGRALERAARLGVEVLAAPFEEFLELLAEGLLGRRRLPGLLLGALRQAL